MTAFEKAKAQFPDEKSAQIYLLNQKYESPVCAKCYRKNSYYYSPDRKAFFCTCGQSSIFPKRDTLFMNSNIPTNIWFYFFALLIDNCTTLTITDLVAVLEVSDPTVRNMFKKTTNMIYTEVISKLSPEEIKTMLANIHPVHQKIDFALQKEYVTEFVRKQNEMKKDPFTELLALAIFPTDEASQRSDASVS